jgi:hypothetical protein
VLRLLQVEAFLQGPSETYQLTGFSCIKHARSAASKLQGQSYGYSVSATSSRTPDNYSITATAQGTGPRACVVIRKTKACWELQVKARQLLGKELMAVRRLVRVVPGAAAEPAAAAAASTEVPAAAAAPVAASAAAAAAAVSTAAPAAAERADLGVPAAALPAVQAMVVDSIDLTGD